MMAATPERSQLQRIIRDLQAAVRELTREFKETREPVTDDNADLRTFFYKVEYLLQFDQKEKFTLLGNRKDYWDYFCDCLAKEKGANDGIRFVKSISELKTSLGKGRAFLRYSLVHQRLADTLQQCFMNTKVTSDWYYARSPFLKPEMSSNIIGHLYELTDVPFDLASRGYDLDATWPTFARKTLNSLGSPALNWKPPSRSSSMNSLISGFSQVQDFTANLDLNNSLCPEPLVVSDELRIELDQSDLKLKELQDRYQQLEKENVELQCAIDLQLAQSQAEACKNNSEGISSPTNVIEDSQKQCKVSCSTQTTAQELQECQQTLEGNTSAKQEECHAQTGLLESSHEDYTSQLQLLTQELETTRADALLKDQQIEELHVKITTAEQKNLELLARIDAILKEKGQQSSMQYESELKIQELLEKLSDSEMEKAMVREHKVMIQQLQEKIELLNRNHVEELMQFKESEEALKTEIEKEYHTRAELEKNMLCLKDELLQAKECSHTVKLENVETKEALRRTYTEMAELGIQICTLSSEKEDTQRNLEQALKKLSELEQQAAVERERLQLNLAELRKENESKGEKLKELEESTTTIPHLQRELNETQKQAETFKANSDDEISTVKFQMSADILNYKNKLTALSKECEQATQDLEKQKQKRFAAENELQEQQVLQDELRKELGQATEKVMQYESTMHTQEEETISLKGHLERIQKELVQADKQAKEYCEKLKQTLLEKESNEQKLEANVDDLTRTKEFLEERLVELIRDKDVLWQKSDALEYEQKIRAEERWLGDTEVNKCLDCQRQFSWMVRRHHCRVCGAIFCYYCCNNYKMTKHSGKKERCCNACYNAPSVVVISDNDSEGSSSQESPLPLDYAATSQTRRVTVTDEDTKPLDDVVFDIITDEELSQIQEANSFLTENPAEGYSPDHSAADLYSSCSSLTLDEPDELQLPQDNEIRLLKNGELMLKLPLTIDEISTFGENQRELFIKSSTYSIIPITVTETGLTISWVFSSDTKSIAFSVVYQESEESPLDQYKVLIPMTRCDSHKETIRGQLKARNCGIYTLIFDNSFSRFISKRVFYHLTVEWPVVYDGSDFP